MRKLTKAKAIAILLYDTMKLGVRKPTEYFMRILEVNQIELYTPIKYLSDLGLIRSFDGSAKGGIERIQDESIETLAMKLEVFYQDIDSLINQCEEVIDATRRLHACDVCDELVPYLNKYSICYDCSKLTFLEPPKRLAKCGHLSTGRYFKCESCEPSLKDDETEYSIGTIERVTHGD